MKLNYLLHRHNTHAVCLKSTAIGGLFNDTETEEVVQRRTRREDDHKWRKDIRNWKKAERTHGWGGGGNYDKKSRPPGEESKRAPVGNRSTNLSKIYIEKFYKKLSSYFSFHYANITNTTHGVLHARAATTGLPVIQSEIQQKVLIAFRLH